MACPIPLLARQPVKTLYILFFALSCFIRIPFLLLYYLPRSLRPRPTWSYQAAVGTAVSRIYFSFITAIRLKTPRSLVPHADKERFESVQPAPTDLYRGVLLNTAIRPATIGCIWLPRLPALSAPPNSSDRVVLHFHGGAYVCFSPRLAAAQYGPSMLCEELSATAMLPQYRLASNPGGAFPAALQDAVTAYAHLLASGVSASRIIISGDSAGAHLALMLMRYLAENSGLLPRPAAVLLHSPWVNLVLKRDANGASDYLPEMLLEWGASSVVPQEEDPAGPYFSPLWHPFSVGVPLWVQLGTAELFYADGEKFVEKMRKEGNVVELYKVPDGMHNTFAGGWMMGLEGEAKAAVKAARAFIDTHCL